MQKPFLIVLGIFSLSLDCILNEIQYNEDITFVAPYLFYQNMLAKILGFTFFT